MLLQNTRLKNQHSYWIFQKNTIIIIINLLYNKLPDNRVQPICFLITTVSTRFAALKRISNHIINGLIENEITKDDRGKKAI